jgi:hypothetical protein
MLYSRRIPGTLPGLSTLITPAFRTRVATSGGVVSPRQRPEPLPMISQDQKVLGDLDGGDRQRACRGVVEVMTRVSLATAVVAAAGVALAHSASGQTGEEKLGKVHFETSCKPQAQKLFDRAMLYQHSFWYRASQMAFEEVLKADPECGISYWGIALSLLWNPHVPTPTKNLTEGAAAIATAKRSGARTQRERDYIDALGIMYADFEKVDHRTRIVAYAKAMEQLAQRYPNDDEAQIHYALALNTSASPADKTYANQLKGAAILEPIFKRQPQHPGVAHYLIHLYDYPPIAEKGLNAARLYAKIAPRFAIQSGFPSGCWAHRRCRCRSDQRPAWRCRRGVHNSYSDFRLRRGYQNSRYCQRPHQHADRRRRRCAACAHGPLPIAQHVGIPCAPDESRIDNRCCHRWLSLRPGSQRCGAQNGL